MYFDDDVVAPNHTGVRCPNNAETLKVQIDPNREQLTPVHAHHVRLRNCYAVGQSPEGAFEGACTRDLIQCLASGRVLFQFTSLRAHRAKEGGDTDQLFPTVAQMLLKKLADSDGTVTLGKRYKVTQFCALPADPVESDATRYTLTARDLATNTERTVFLTQGGLRFVDKLLEPKEIARAAELLESHPSSPTSCIDAALHPQT